MQKHPPPGRRNGPAQVTPQQRARICETILHELALEYFRRTNSRREAWARICIGLRPFPRLIDRIAS